MTYQEFRNTYKNLLKKHCEISNLFEAGYIIEMEKTEYLKIGSKWKENAKITKEVDYIHYCNVFDAVYFFKNLGGYERTIKPTYAEIKENIKEIAIDWQLDFDNHGYSYYDLIRYNNFFEFLARKYGLIKEFKENCII